MTASELIRKHEGLRLSVYKDSRGIATIGYGFNLQAQHALYVCNLFGLDYAVLLAGTASLTQEQADKIFEHQLGVVQAQAHITFRGYDSMPANVQAVIADVIFNLGWAGFQGFHQTIAAFKAGNWNAAADALKDSLWFKQVGTRAVEDVALLRAS